MEAAAALVAYIDQLVAFFEDSFAALRKRWRQQALPRTDGFARSIRAFFHAIDWTEPWLILVVVFHIMLLGMAIRTRKHNNMQMGLFAFALFGVCYAERLNSLLAHNWASFARRPYFDHYGVFISALWSGPLLVISCVVLANSMVTLAMLIIKWKRVELTQRANMAAHKEE